MYLLIPLGGLGIRFKNLGYNRPKSLVKVFGKEIIFWLLDNLNLNGITEIIIPYNKELKKYNFEDLIQKKFSQHKFKFMCLDKDTNGAVETVYTILNHFNFENLPILLLDGDNFYTTDIISLWNKENKIMVFEDYSNEPIYSYIQTNQINKVSDIIEKNKISNLACTGAYGFNSLFELKYYCKKILDNNIKIKNEFYTSIVISEMLKNNIIFNYEKINIANYICLGTPIQVRLFCNNFPKINSYDNKLLIKPLRICFDLDNTLVSYPVIPNDYTTVKPLQKNIDYLIYLKKFGHTIIIYTARKMKSSGSNIGLVNKNVGKITFDTLEKFNIPYDEIYFGKPYADFYIDDLGFNAYIDLEKELGFYQNNIDPREFNNISKQTLEIIKKESKNKLDGEIYFYNNIPLNIKDMFPIMFEYDNLNYNWYKLEHIDGIPLSKIFLSQELNLIQFENVLNSIDRIHKSFDLNNSNNTNNLNNSNNTNNTNNLNIYQNYSLKLKKRFNDYDYSKFAEFMEIYNDLLIKLDNYEKNNCGKIGIIHGDPVFTNILINKYGKIKLIDMRGKINDELTIFGDELYDWAKIYQSLIGYDEILDDTNVNTIYLNQFINVFENKILEIYKNEIYLKYIKTITKSLLFSLIPLHNNDKCFKYFELIKKIN